MTAGLGSEYRYFGKLVLVPFRYFSIDIYRNIDIFDNTRALISLLYNTKFIATEIGLIQRSRVKTPTKENTDLHDGGIILTNETSTSDPL